MSLLEAALKNGKKTIYLYGYRDVPMDIVENSVRATVRQYGWGLDYQYSSDQRDGTTYTFTLK